MTMATVYDDLVDEDTGFDPLNSWSEHRRKSTTTMRPYILGETLDGVSVNPEDDPSKGGWIARNKRNPKDMWFVSKDYYENEYEPA